MVVAEMSNNYVHLLRHGQFVKDPGSGDGRLTTIGRRQARRAAARLCERRIAKLYSSDAQRARETAEIVAERLPEISVTALPVLREMLPTRVPGLQVSLQSRRHAQRRIDEVIGRFFTRPPKSGDIVLVCHGNLIRALLCRILGMPMTRWQELGTLHCGVTSFSIREDGKVRLQCFNDSGHLSGVLRTSI